MHIRSELPSDYHAIASVNYHAFANWQKDRVHLHESEMPSLARQRRTFDPELSVVAERNGAIIGHSLLVPASFTVLGKRVQGVLLGPIAVAPQHQKEGVGSALIAQGHAVAARKGFEFSLLCGHPEYYPRFGYLQDVFSMAGSTIQMQGRSVGSQNYTVRPLHGEDVSLIVQWQNAMRAQDTLAILHDADVLEFNSTSPSIDCLVICDDDLPVGYVKRSCTEPQQIKTLYGDQRHLKRILDFLCRGIDGDQALSIAQPVEHFHNLSQDEDVVVKDLRRVHPAFMICPLKQDSVIHEYCTSVRNGDVPPGVISYPPYCDVD